MGNTWAIGDSLDPAETSAARRPALCGELNLPAEAASVTRARRAARLLARQNGCSAMTQAKVALAVSEAVGNAVVHGYAAGSGIRMITESSLDEFVVTIADGGSGLTPRSDSPGLGLGLAIIAQVTSDLRIDVPPGGGTRLRMAFRRI